MAHKITQRSPRSIHIDNFAVKKEHYYSPGLLIQPCSIEGVPHQLGSILLYQGASRIPAEPGD